MPQCAWLLPCRYDALPNEDYCGMHCRALGIKITKEKKVPTPIKKKSDKQKEIDKELAKLYKVIISVRPLCEVKSPECTGKSETGHHVRSRGKNEVLDTENIMSCCFRCNSYIESHDQWARDNGFKKSKFYQ